MTFVPNPLKPTPLSPNPNCGSCATAVTPPADATAPLEEADDVVIVNCAKHV